MKLDEIGLNWMKLDATGCNWMELDGTGWNWMEHTLNLNFLFITNK